MKKVSVYARVLVAMLLLASPAPVAAQVESIRVAGDLQAWADANRNGTLEPGEIDVLGAAIVGLLSGTHPGSTPLDRMFDGNGDGRIDEREAQPVTEYLFVYEKVRAPHRADTPGDKKQTVVWDEK